MRSHVSALAAALLLGPVLFSGSLSAFGMYGSPYAPSFGGGVYHYTDGLVINGKTFDISGYSQKIPTQNLTTGIQSNVTLKIYDNAGSYVIKTATIFLNTRGAGASVQNSDTWIEYDVSGRTVIEDPHHFIASARGSVAYSGKFAFVTFEITPRSPMGMSDMIVSSTNVKSYIGYSLVTGAISFTGKTINDQMPQNADYVHQHCTAAHPCQNVCGDHICRPGETPKERP